MIRVTRLDGSELVLNGDLIETIEHQGDTVVTLLSGSKYLVRESVEVLIDAVQAHKGAVLANARLLAPTTALPPASGAGAAGRSRPPGWRVISTTTPDPDAPHGAGR